MLNAPALSQNNPQSKPAQPLPPLSSTAFDPQTNEAVREFINRVSTSQHIDRSILETLLRKAQFVQRSLDLTKPSGESASKTTKQRDWPTYRARYLTEARLAAAEKFMRAYQKPLAAAEEKYGVPTYIIASILNIESRYGESLGRFKTLDVLATLAFYHPTRAAFFTKELEALIDLWRSGFYDIDTLYGSFAGAVGIPQFMPSNINAYATDFDNDGFIDLNHPEDAIGTAAQFLQKHGWKRPEPNTTANQLLSRLLIPAKIAPGVSEEDINALLKEGPKATLDADKLVGKVLFDEKQPPQFPVLLVDLPRPDTPLLSHEFRLGSVNYFVITRYNRSFDYATAVYDLAIAIRCRMEGCKVN